MEKETSVVMGRLLAGLIFLGAGIAGYIMGGINEAVPFAVLGGLVGWFFGFAFPALIVRLLALAVVIAAVGGAVVLVAGQLNAGG